MTALGVVSVGYFSEHASVPRTDALIFLGDGGTRFTVPFEPAEVKVTRAAGWVEEARPGGGVKPALLRGPGVLQSCAFTLTIGRRDNLSVAPILTSLRSAADGSQRWAISYLPLGVGGLWRILTLDLTATDWDSVGTVTRATADLTLTEAGSATAVGPATGGLGALALQQRPATYTVHAGDSLVGVAIKFYGEARYIWAIGYTNKLRNWVLHAGQVLKLPNSV